MSLEFLIASTFTGSLARLTAAEQKAAKLSAFDLQVNAGSNALSLHRIDRSRDPNFWSVRVNSDIRIIVHRTESSFLLAYIGHHDDAYTWAERRRIEAHPRTGVIQIVEVRERVEQSYRPPSSTENGEETNSSVAPKLLFDRLSTEQLLQAGVPQDWIDDVQGADEDSFFVLAEHLPSEAVETLFDFVVSGTLPTPQPAVLGNPFAHPDSLRHFRVVENQSALEVALDSSWASWSVFLHPLQQNTVEKSYAGPARVSGSAGTGKTVVALHRAVRLARTQPTAKVLLTTFNSPLAKNLFAKLHTLCNSDAELLARFTVVTLDELVVELFQLVFGWKGTIATDEQIDDIVQKVLSTSDGIGYSKRFLKSEWTHVVDAWQIADVSAYEKVPRLGRKNRMSANQRHKLWPVLNAMRESVAKRGLMTWSQLYAKVEEHFRSRRNQPFEFIIVDESQDLSVAQLRFLSAIAVKGANALFFAGDSGQRIFQQPFSWKELGIEVRGRSSNLYINYRTSHQIRKMADKLLPSSVRDVDGNNEERNRTLSAFNGPVPEVKSYDSADDEILGTSVWITSVIDAGILPEEIGIFVRSRAEIPRARAAVEKAGIEWAELSEFDQDAAGMLSIGTMHLVKGLEFKAVTIMACDENVLPLQARLEAAADEVELDDVYETERRLFYVACTRSRDILAISGVRRVSEFIDDLETISVGLP